MRFRGIKLEGKKESSLLSWSFKKPALPAVVRIPLITAGILAEPCVTAGQRVLTGQRIGKAAASNGVDIHASVSGRVIDIRDFPHPVYGLAAAVEIESDGKDEKAEGIGAERAGWQDLPREELLALFSDRGLVDLTPEETPLHLKAAAPCDLLILNACESEPYVTNEHSLLLSYPIEIIKGAEILKRALGAGNICIVTEKNKSEAAETLRSKIYFHKLENVEVRVLPVLYPSGNDKLLSAKLRGDLPYRFASAAVFNAATAFAVYEAVVMQKPLYERGVTIAGECVVEPKNLWARVGTDFRFLIKSCRGLMREPRKVLMGGPMTGIAQAELDVPMTRGTQAVLALPKETAVSADIQPCVRCGRCTDACPSDISPAAITLAAQNEELDLAGEFGAGECIECGNCSYVCPSGRPMLELMRYAMNPEINFEKSGSGYTELLEKVTL